MKFDCGLHEIAPSNPLVIRCKFGAVTNPWHQPPAGVVARRRLAHPSSRRSPSQRVTFL
jgi:hypothetical protein